MVAKTPIYAEDVGQVVAVVAVEIVYALTPHGEGANEALELVASRLLDATRNLVPGPGTTAIQSAAEMLVKSEIT